MTLSDAPQVVVDGWSQVGQMTKRAPNLTCNLLLPLLPPHLISVVVAR